MSPFEQCAQIVEALYRECEDKAESAAIPSSYTRYNGAAFELGKAMNRIRALDAPKVASDTGAGLRSMLQEAHDTLHECTAVLHADDCRTVAAVMERIRNTLATPTDATDGATGGGEVERCARHLAAVAHAVLERGYISAFIEEEKGDHDALLDAVAEMKRALATTPGGDLLEQAARYRHVKRGTVYEVIGTAELQASQLQAEHAELIIYRGEDGKLWARNSGEFHDGRFEPLKPAGDGGEA